MALTCGALLVTGLLLPRELAGPVLASASAAEPSPRCAAPAEPQFGSLVTPGIGGPAARSHDQQGVPGVRGIDISRWDHPNDEPINWDRLVAAHDISFVMIKASDGDIGTKSDWLSERWFPIDRAEARRVGLRVGAYHYARPNGRTRAAIRADARTEARLAASRTGTLQPGDLPLVLDLEEAPGYLRPELLTLWATTFLREAEEKTGRRPMIYSNPTFLLTRVHANADLAAHPLWVAHYGSRLRSPAVPPPWSLTDRAVMWQFSSKGRLAGMPRTEVGDLNVLLGGQELFDQLSGIAPMPDPDPALLAELRGVVDGVTGRIAHRRTGGTREGARTWAAWRSGRAGCPPDGLPAVPPASPSPSPSPAPTPPGAPAPTPSAAPAPTTPTPGATASTPASSTASAPTPSASPGRPSAVGSGAPAG